MEKKYEKINSEFASFSFFIEIYLTSFITQQNTAVTDYNHN